MLTVFNWTEKCSEYTIKLAALGISAEGRYAITDVFDMREMPLPVSGVLELSLPAHSVLALKIKNTVVPNTAPIVAVDHPSVGAAGETLTYSATSQGGDPAIAFVWDFGDGVKADGQYVTHAWTEPGEYQIQVTVKGLSGKSAEKQFEVRITRYMSTIFNSSENKRSP
jgi:PKD repeat protein